MISQVNALLSIIFLHSHTHTHTHTHIHALFKGQNQYLVYWYLIEQGQLASKSHPPLMQYASLQVCAHQWGTHNLDFAIFWSDKQYMHTWMNKWMQWEHWSVMWLTFQTGTVNHPIFVTTIYISKSCTYWAQYVYVYNSWNKLQLNVFFTFYCRCCKTF